MLFATHTTHRIPTAFHISSICGYVRQYVYRLSLGLIVAQSRYSQLDELPAVYAALKADLDKTTQRAEVQPDVYTREIGMSAPLHVSAAWTSISELFVTVCPIVLVIMCLNYFLSVLSPSDFGMRRSRKLPCLQTQLLPGRSRSRLIEQTCILQRGLQVNFFPTYFLSFYQNQILTRLTACTILTLFFMWKRSNPG